MAKVCLISDTHLGVKKSNEIFLNSQVNFMRDEFIPYLTDNRINDIYILGDLFDNRNHINIKTLKVSFELFENDLKPFNVSILLGNHDIYYNTNIQTHSLKWLEKFKNITLIEEIQEIDVHGLKVLAVPWLVNTKIFNDYLSNNVIEAKVCFGHFQTAGFLFSKHTLSETGMDGGVLFNNFKITFTGHFHTRSKQKKNGNVVQYLGSPYHLTRNDTGDEKGFTILDTETLEYEMIDNKHCLRYISLDYPTTRGISKKEIKGNIIDVNIVYNEDYNEEKVQQFLNKIEQMKPALPPIPKVINGLSTLANSDDYMVKSSSQLMVEYVKNLSDIKNKDEVLQHLQQLYEECLNDI